MRLNHLRWQVVIPALKILEDVSQKHLMADHRAQVLLLSIALQESAARHRHQIQGPARGWWQFERNGGTRGVLQHASTAAYAKAFCEAIDIDPDLDSVWEALPYSELLQAGMARLLLWSHPKPLPMAMTANEGPSWDYYQWLWRPGKPHPDRWPGNWALALQQCGDF